MFKKHTAVLIGLLMSLNSVQISAEEEKKSVPSTLSPSITKQLTTGSKDIPHKPQLEPKTIETIRIYNNGYREITKDGNKIYYKQEGDFVRTIKNQELAQDLINSGGAELIVEAKVKQYGNNANNVNVLVGGYSPTAFIGVYGVTPVVVGNTWNKNNFSDKSVRDIMNNQEGIAVVVSYDTHWDYGGPGSSFNNSLQGAFKNLMNQAEFELKNAGMTQNTTTITSYSTGHYLAMDYLTDKTRKEFEVVTYNAVAPNIRGSVLENNFQKLEGEDAYDDIIKNSAYTAILNGNPYFRDNVQVNAYFTTQDFKQDTFSVIYYTDEKDKNTKLKYIADNYFWQVKDENLKLYLPDGTVHTEPQKIYAQLNNQTLPYYYEDQIGNIAYYDTKVLLEVKKDQLTLQRNIKKNTLMGVLKNAPCGAKTTEITSLQGEINSIGQQIGEIDGQINSLNSE